MKTPFYGKMVEDLFLRDIRFNPKIQNPEDPSPDSQQYDVSAMVSENGEEILFLIMPEDMGYDDEPYEVIYNVHNLSGKIWSEYFNLKRHSYDAEGTSELHRQLAKQTMEYFKEVGFEIPLERDGLLLPFKYLPQYLCEAKMAFQKPRPGSLDYF